MSRTSPVQTPPAPSPLGPRGPSYQLEGVWRRWPGRVALQDINLRIPAGQKVGLVGPSGGGKTTLIRVLGGVLRATEGAVRVDGVDLAQLSRAGLRRFRASAGIVGQGLNLVPQLSVHQNVIAGYLPSWPWYLVALSALWPLRRQRVREVLEGVGIGERQWDSSSILSGGQQQRVAIARALVAGPRTILADEPTSSLDPRTADLTTGLIVRAAEEARATLVFCTHRFSALRAHVDRVIGLRGGRVVLDGPPGEVDDLALDALYEGTHERPLYVGANAGG